MSDLHAQLHAFAAHVRDPGAHAPPAGIDDRRLAVYRDLVANNLRSLLAGNFPVIRKTLGQARWHALVARFQACHRSRTPLFTRIGAEFVDWLQQSAPSTDGDDAAHAWLAELAHYEWCELALQILDAPLPAHEPTGDVLHGAVCASSHAWPLAYRYAVHRIGPGAEPAAMPGHPTLLLLRRDAGGDVRFSELSPLVYRLLQLAGTDAPRTGHALLLQLAAEAHASADDAFMRDGTAMLQRLRDEGALLVV